MKKILTVLLSIAMIFTLAACGGGSDDNGGATTGGSDVEQVAVFWYTFADDYLSTVRAALNNEFNAAGISYKDYDGNGNQTDHYCFSCWC